MISKTPIVASADLKERPVVMSAWEVRATLDGRKTQLRRVANARGADRVRYVEGARLVPQRSGDEPFTGWVAEVDKLGGERGLNLPLICPFGNPGDRLWVRETWTARWEPGKGRRWRVCYREDGEQRVSHPPDDWVVPKSAHKAKAGTPSWVGALSMPRWASRLTLEIVNVRVERLQEISEENATSEGVEPYSITEEEIANVQISDGPPWEKELTRLMGPGSFSHKFTYQMQWDELNGKRRFSWKSNPWVWVVEFKPVKI